MAQDAAIQMAETLQTAHMNNAPSVEHDINPSTAASHKEPVSLRREASTGDVDSDVDEDEIPVSLLRTTPRKPQMPPLPDLRFEQSYLASIKDAKDWKVVTYITMRDQVCDDPNDNGTLANLHATSGDYAPRSRSSMDSHRIGMAVLECRHQVQWTDCWR
jgi:hypothetical protein